MSARVSLLLAVALTACAPDDGVVYSWCTDDEVQCEPGAPDCGTYEYGCPDGLVPSCAGQALSFCEPGQDEPRCSDFSRVPCVVP